MLGKLDAARSAGRYGEAEIALLKEKLAIVVSAFASERAKREGEMEALASAAHTELSEREYALSSARLELSEARRLIKILEAREESTRDDLDEALTSNEVLKAQLVEEHECASALRREANRLRDALRDAGEALADAAEREEELANKPPTSSMDDFQVRLERENANARIARLEEKVAHAQEENKELRRKVQEAEGESSELQRAVAERDGAQRFLKTQLADWNQRLYARAEGSVDGESAYASDSSAELRTRLDEVEIELGAKTGAVKALERRVKDQDKALERARAEIEKMREKLLARDDDAFERRLASAPQSKYVASAEKAAAEVMDNLRASRAKHVSKRGRDQRASRRDRVAMPKPASSGASKKRAPPASRHIDTSEPFQPPQASDADEDEGEDDEEYEEVDVPVKRVVTKSRTKAKREKKQIEPVAAKENRQEDAAPAAQDGPRMPLGMIQMPKLGARKDKSVDGGAQKKRRLNRQSAIPEALPSLLFGVAETDFRVADAQ